MLLKEKGLFNPFDFYVVDRSNDVEEKIGRASCRERV